MKWIKFDKKWSCRKQIVNNIDYNDIFIESIETQKTE